MMRGSRSGWAGTRATALALLLASCSGLAAKPPVVIEVSDCAPAQTPLATLPARKILAEVAGNQLEAASPSGKQAWLSGSSPIAHPFLRAAHLAFADHRPLAISPDMIWQLLIQQAAAEVHAKPEAHRKLLAAHPSGKRTLSVRRDQFRLGEPRNDWPGVFAELEGMILQRVAGSPAAGFAHAFSTSTPTDIAARRVVTLNAAAEFYSYHMSTKCGIPRIELHGSAEDWRWIRKHAADLECFHMKKRLKALQPVLNELVAAAEGRADPAFWKSYYKHASESGGDLVSGWINLFFIDESNPRLDAVLAPKFSWVAPPTQLSVFDEPYLPLAMSVGSYQSRGVTDVDFVWQYHDQTYPMRIRAGFLGVAQDPQSLTLKPATAWQVMRVKLTSEEQQAVDFLSQLEHLPARLLKRDFRFDAQRGSIRIERHNGNAGEEVRFWSAAFPLMHRLRVIDAGPLLDDSWTNEQKEALCRAMLSAKSVREVVVPNSISPKCLVSLLGRSDWKVNLEEER